MNRTNLLAFGYMLAPIVLGAQGSQTPVITHWCAEPRPNEPLLQDATNLGTSNDSASVSKRYLYRVRRVSREQIVQVRNKLVCQRAGIAYRDHLRRYVRPDWPDAPVLVIRIGEMYLVDDLRPRAGPDAYWEAMIFDAKWKHRICYGEGA